ncbi:GDSL-type esterase/lipase family protein [Streptomyces sp. BPTC-684]|uniref:GDSL-type esterase/lipase family protein n=1 Tax=Streptomyces sp. BPTC-684 TaxID=3043734 RepID=UPI0024B04AEF|nr:GDSL-type esterase/lipase family protein [Streptomyces sp. BPTC-684]WHM41011.1 GDSL-type esterase/lipase family protein [Streptomyces sp. BPTC-684]
MAQTLCVALLASLVTLLAPAAAQAIETVDKIAITYNMQGGTAWSDVRSILLPTADIVALQEATTPPDTKFTDDAQVIAENLDDTAKTPSGYPSLKYRLYAKKWGGNGSRRPGGVLLYLKILDRTAWGADPASTPTDPGTDPDEQEDQEDVKKPPRDRNTQKSMAIWLRDVPDDIGTLKGRVKIFPAEDPKNKWIRTRPAFGVEVGGTWYFNIHAASIRADTKPNPHTVALIDTITRQMAGKRWRALGDFNSLPDATRVRFPNTFYATEEGVPGGTPVDTQQSHHALDYMIASDQLENLAVSRSEQQGSSDHWPVKFNPVDKKLCNTAWPYGWETVYNRTAQRLARAAAGDACGPPTAVVSMGDSYVSGEGGRWAGNAAASATGSAWGTDRAAVNCNGEESVCDHDLTKVYGDTSYDKGGSACDRSDSAEIRGVNVDGVPAERRFNIACSGATTDNVTTTGFKGQRPQVDDLRDIAQNNDVRMVVLSIGGNDLKFADILQDCVKAYFYPSLFNKGCRGAKEKQFADGLGPVRAKVVQSVEAIRKTLRDAGQEDDSYQIVLQSYPNPLPIGRNFRDPENAPVPPANYSRYLSGGCPFLDADSDWAHTSVVPRISAMLRGAANEAGVSFLDLQDAFAGHELCNRTTRQATSSEKLTAPLPAERAEWVRWVPYVVDGLKDLPWQAQGNQQEAIHPNYYGQRALSACLTKIAAQLGDTPVFSSCVGKPSTAPADIDGTVDNSTVLSRSNRRAPVAGLPDWSRAGYRAGEELPGAAARNADPACHLTPSALEQQFKVKADDGQDDTAGIQAAIDQIRNSCTPSANPGRLSVIELPKGVLDVSKQLSVDASYLVIRGQGADPANGSRIVFRPDANTRYDVLTEKGERWDQGAMTHKCEFTTGNNVGSGGWIWPGRGLFRVQTREAAEKYAKICGFPSKIPENRRDLFEGSINQHWESGVAVAGSAADANYAAHQGDRVIQLNAKAKMDVFKPGGDLWVGAANSLKFYQTQQVAGAAADDGRLENLHMRQQVFTITSVDAAQHAVTIDKPLEFDVPVDSTSDGSPALGVGGKPYVSKVTPLKMITDVGFEDFSFTEDLNGLPKLRGGTYQLTPAQAVHNYGNMAPEYAMHGIVFKWASDSWVRGVRADMVGSHPVVTEVARNIQVERNVFDGSWNKGKGGNGYLRGSRVWDSLYAFNTSRNLRHFTFQWSASGNVAIGNDFDSDLNLHGGWEHRNLFENNTVHVPYNHSSGQCETNCGGEGPGGDNGTWWPIYWAAGSKGIGWSGSTGPQNVFFHNTLTKQLAAGGPYQVYGPYADTSRVFQFGSSAADPSVFQHLRTGGAPVQDWADNERNIYTGGDGVNASRTDPSSSLFLRDYRS